MNSPLRNPQRSRTGTPLRMSWAPRAILSHLTERDRCCLRVVYIFCCHSCLVERMDRPSDLDLALRVRGHIAVYLVA